MVVQDTMIMTHSDCDGICAGALALARFPGSRVFFTKPVSFLRDLQENVLNHIPKKLVICDIAINKRTAIEVVDALKKIQNSSSILYFDHHALPDNINIDMLNQSTTIFAHDTTVSASEMIYRNFQDSIPKERVWLALYGALGDYTDDTEFTQNRLLNWDKRALYFEVSTLVMGIKQDTFSKYSSKRRIVEVLANGGNPSDVRGLVKSAKEAVTREFELYKHVKRRAKSTGNIGFIKDLNFGFRGPSALFAATVTGKLVGLSMHTVGNNIDVTARIRSPDPNIRLNKIMEHASESVGGSGGGHPHAAGARIPKSKMLKFLDIVNKMI